MGAMSNADPKSHPPEESDINPAWIALVPLSALAILLCVFLIWVEVLPLH
jgi:hypothetical protein